MAVLAAVLLWQIAFPRILEDIRLHVFDSFQKISPRIYAPAPVVIVDIDDDSLAKLGQWPWPRAHVAELLDRLKEAGASAIAMDILFAEPDRLSAKNDEILAESIRTSKAITSFALVYQPNTATPAVRAGFGFKGQDPREFLAAYRGAIMNLPNLAKAAAGNACFNMARGTGGIVRKVPLVYSFRDQLYPSLALDGLRVHQGEKNILIQTSGASTGIVQIQCGDFVIPTDAQGHLWLYDTGHRPERYISAWKILSGTTDPEVIKGKVVILGISAVGLKDIKPTPNEPLMPGAEIHAQILEQIFTRQFLARPDWAVGAEIAFTLVFGILLLVAMHCAGALAGVIWCAAFLLAAVALSWNAFNRGLLLDPLFPSLSLLAVYISSSIVKHLSTENEKRRIRDAFGRYVSPELVRSLVKNPGVLRLGGQTKPITVLFADIRGFTSLSEQMKAEELIAVINSIFTPITEIILRNRGTVDKFIGDCVMAFWNAPIDQPNHAELAVQTAIQIQRTLDSINSNVRGSAGLPPGFEGVRIGIGISTGNCAVGNMGSELRFDYSVIGDAVNLAARLQELTKDKGQSILMSGATAALIQTIPLQDLGDVSIRGRSEAVRIWSPAS